MGTLQKTNPAGSEPPKENVSQEMSTRPAHAQGDIVGCGGESPHHPEALQRSRSPKKESRVLTQGVPLILADGLRDVEREVPRDGG